MNVRYFRSLRSAARLLESDRNSVVRMGSDFAFSCGMIALIWLMLCSSGVSAQEFESAPEVQVPLVEQEPFDMILLDEVNGNVEIQISPLKENLSEPLPEQGFLIFEAKQLSDDRLQIPYANIAKYSSFNDLLRAEANQFIREQEYGKAFRNLIYIFDHDTKQDAELANTIQNLLFRDAAKNYLSGNYELALSIFQDIYDRDPNFEVPDISKRPIDLILDCLDKNIANNFSAERFDQVRAAVDDLELLYDAPGRELAEKWRGNILAQSDLMLADARRLANAGDGQQAHLMARKANSILPGRPETNTLFQEIVDKFPIVFVGVSQSGGVPNSLSLDNWGTRRVGKLTMRNMVEFVGPGDDGGKYEFLNGKLEQIDDNGFVYRFTIQPEPGGFAVPPIDANQLSRTLLARASVGFDEYDIPLARIVDSVAIENEFSVVVRLNTAFVRPEALFQFPYDLVDQSPAANGPYVLTEKSEKVTVFNRNPAYPELAGAQHPQIVEWLFPTASEAANALIAGEVDVIDRVQLADLHRLEENASIGIGSYIVPTVHMLIPNNRNDFTRDRSFRNGLKQGINRELILHEIICGGREINGCEVISGPFPIGTEENDQVSYAYNLSVTPQPFNDLLGMVLTRVIYESRINSLIKEGVKDPQIEIPTIVLAHAADQLSELACVNIQQMWGAIGIKTVLRRLDEGVVVPPDDEWDFLYYQMSMQEPLTDSEQLFGRNGIVGDISAPARQNMQQLGYASGWQQAGQILRSLHRQLVNDVSIIPLWQTREQFAYRTNVKGIGRDLVYLYQNVELWRIMPTTEGN